MRCKRRPEHSPAGTFLRTITGLKQPVLQPFLLHLEDAHRTTGT